MKLTTNQLELLRDALIDAYRTYDALDELATTSGMVTSLELDLGLKEKAVTTVAFELLRHLDSKGEDCPGRLLSHARQRQPANTALIRVERAFGVNRIELAANLLNTRHFDLRPLEVIWRKELLRPGKRLVLFAISAEQSVLTNVIDRLRAFVGQPESTSLARHTINGKVRSIDKIIDLIAKLKPRLAGSGIVCMVDAESAEDSSIELLLASVITFYADQLTNHMVLLINFHQDRSPPASCVQLPTPQFEDTDLFQWVEDVTQGKGWGEDLRDAFKLWLHRTADEDPKPTSDVAYSALGEAIELLRNHPLEADLRRHLQSLS